MSTFRASTLRARLGDQVRIRRARHAREALALLVIGAVAVVGHAFWADPRILALAVVAIALAVGTWIFVAVAGARSSQVHRLTERAADVVWVFAEIGARNARDASLVFAFVDGTSVTLPVEPSAMDALLAEASMELPRAAIGFSGAHREAFHRDPRSLLGPPRTEPEGKRAFATSHAWLVEPARAVMFAARFAGGLGVVLALLGGAGFAVVLAAAPPGAERAMLAGILGLIGLAGLGLTAFGFRPFESTALHRALATGEGLLNVQLLEGEGPTGDVEPMAVVTLKSGHRYTFHARRPPAPTGMTVLSVVRPDQRDA